MNDIIPGGEHTSTSVLAKQGLAAAGGIAGGVLFLIMGALPPVAGIIAGVVVGVVGLGAFLSKDPADKKPGAVIAAAGVLAILSRLPFLGKLAGGLLGLGTFGLFAMGVWNGVKFLRGLKSRS
ncbi:MAG: hypothetical protein LBP32_05585 [Spirochaetaceae bacterium]|jgi:hypothetical protein|nr:hypothetical protein [Spirochaetaceae bacterium]